MNFHNGTKKFNTGGTYGLSFQTERKIENSFYLGLGTDLLISDALTDSRYGAYYKMDEISLGIYPTLGYQASDNLSINIMAGASINYYKSSVFRSKYNTKLHEVSESGVGILYGASMDYRLAKTLSLGLMYRHSKVKFNDDLDVRYYQMPISTKRDYVSNKLLVKVTYNF